VDDVETDFGQVEAEEVHLHLLTADLARDLGVLDAVVDGPEILCGEGATEGTENTEDRK
jgi:hypothetical protein